MRFQYKSTLNVAKYDFLKLLFFSPFPPRSASILRRRSPAIPNTVKPQKLRKAERRMKVEKKLNIEPDAKNSNFSIQSSSFFFPCYVILKNMKSKFFINLN
jgi:hypothetical protein